jgi:transcriptional regulator of met regulon
LLGEDIGVIISKFGDVKEVYGTTGIISKIMKPYPDSVKAKEGEFIKNQINARIGQYVLETMMHYPDQPLAKDSTQKKDYEDNVPIAASVTFPMQINIRQVLTGFEERGDKVLAVFMTNSTARPVRSVITEGPVKATLDNSTMSTKEDIRVEDATGMLVYRNVIEDKTYSLTLESSEAAGRTIQTDEKAKSTTKVELLK